MANYTRLSNSSAAFKEMIKRFGIVTVMNAKVFNVADITDTYGDDFFKTRTAYQIYSTIKDMDPLVTLDTLKIANASQEGPTKKVTGGQYTNPLIKFGKTTRLEMQDALGNAEAIEALSGGLVEYSGSLGGDIIGLHIGSDFTGPKFILGDTFFIDQKSGLQVAVKIMFYQFLPDSIFNITQDAEGDPTVFDMNGDLLTTDILVGDRAGNNIVHGATYSIIDENAEDVVDYYSIVEGKITLASGYTATLDGEAVVSGTTSAPAEGTAALLVVKDASDNVVLSKVLVG